MGFPLLFLSLFFAVQLHCPRAKSSTTRAFNHWLCCGEMMVGAIEAK
jgi:hypothetical protein